jgi:hypothetical protein
MPTSPPSLRAIAKRERRNSPHRRDPERFHTEKSCIVQDLEALADRIEDRAVVLPSEHVVVELPR